MLHFVTDKKNLPTLVNLLALLFYFLFWCLFVFKLSSLTFKRRTWHGLCTQWAKAHSTHFVSPTHSNPRIDVFEFWTFQITNWTIFTKNSSHQAPASLGGQYIFFENSTQIPNFVNKMCPEHVFYYLGLDFIDTLVER